MANPIADLVAGFVSQVTGYDLQMLQDRARNRQICDARFIFAYHCHQLGLSKSEIGRILSRSHSTVMHMISEYDNALLYSKDFRLMAHTIDDLLINYADIKTIFNERQRKGIQGKGSKKAKKRHNQNRW